MSPSRGVRRSALVVFAALVMAVPAEAQTLFDDPNQLIEGASDPLIRSPRLIGMGRLSFVLDDANHRINFWDLGRNPIGVIDADSLSTLEFGPTTSATSTVSDAFGVVPPYEWQLQAARDFRFFYEAWRRGENTTYGFLGDVARQRDDIAYDGITERRTQLTRPSLMPILTGRLPLVKTDRLTYALRGLVATPSNTGKYRLYVQNGAGLYLDKDGAQINPPNLFNPEEFKVRTAGIGAHVAARIAPVVKLAVGYDFYDHKIDGENSGLRHESELHEKRPYHVGTVTAGGVTRGGFEWAADAKGWRSFSDQAWLFTTSAGTAVDPLNGRGKLLDRDEKGSSLKARARWRAKRFEIGAGFATTYRQVENTPPAASDVSSLNHFLNIVFLRDGADSLALPDSVVHNVVEDRSWEAGGGVAWNLPWRGSVLGVEGHYFGSRHGEEQSGEGPKSLGWDIRSGLEWALSPVLDARAGYSYRWEDLDDFTVQNEFTSHLVAAGLGYRPAGVRWRLDAGYDYQWTRSDYTDPLALRTGRQQLSTRLRWLF